MQFKSNKAIKLKYFNVLNVARNPIGFTLLLFCDINSLWEFNVPFKGPFKG